MVRPTDKESIAIESRAHNTMGATWGSTGGGETGQETLLRVPQEGTREGGKSGLGLPRPNNVGGLWGIGAVPGCLVTGLGVIRTGG